VGALVGRSEQIQELATLLDGSPLVTLAGPPGIGKTRLAQELALVLPGRSCFVELGPVTDPALIPRALASALAVPEAPGQPLDEAVLASLRRRRGLLVLDNCEHLLAACAQTVEALVSACPKLRILLTSREPLAIGIETVWQVPGLAVPDPDDDDSPAALAANASVRLFVERAGVLHPGFGLNPYVAPAVAEICRRLDGIPLALELAAACVESLTPADIAARLDDRFDLLTNAGHAALPRHRTLLAALDWSHELLSEPERALLRRLSVFTGGFELDALQAVCAGPDLAADHLADLLARLTAKSLVVGNDGRPGARSYLLETIRVYASDRLEEAGEAGQVRPAHARFYLALSEQAEPELTGPSQDLWLGRLDSERENLRLALDWCLGHGHCEWALRLAGALVLFWRVRCHFSEGRRFLDAAVSAGGEMPVALQAKALWGAGFMALMAGDVDAAIPAVERSLAYFREVEDPQGQARALLILANCEQHRDRSNVLSRLEESAGLARAAEDRWCLAHARGVAGFELLSREDLAAAASLFEECLDVAREARDRQSVRMGLIGLASVTVRQGDYRLTESLLDEAMLIVDELGEDYSKEAGLRLLAQLAFARGEHRRARELLGESLDLIGEGGPPHSYVEPLILLADVARAEGDRDRARLILEQARGLSGPAPPLDVIRGLGGLAGDEGDLRAARELLERNLDDVRGLGLKDSEARALFALGELARTEGDAARASALHAHALRIYHEIGVAPGAVASLEALVGLDPAAEGYALSARLLAAADAIRRAQGYARPAREASRYRADLAVIREALGEEVFAAAWAEGADLSLEDAVDEALRGGGGAQPRTGWSSLTDREHEVAALVAEGLTNPEIAERLHVSLSTVKAHLSHTFTKLGVAGRTELAREVWRRDQDQPPTGGSP